MRQVEMVKTNKQKHSVCPLFLRDKEVSKVKDVYYGFHRRSWACRAMSTGYIAQKGYVEQNLVPPDPNWRIAFYYGFSYTYLYWNIFHISNEDPGITANSLFDGPTGTHIQTQNNTTSTWHFFTK